MIYTGYIVKFYIGSNGRYPVREYIDNLTKKDRAKVLKYIEFLRENKGVLDEPYTKHVGGKIRELRVDFGRNKHRIFFFTLINKKIILLHAYLKKTPKMPPEEFNRAKENYLEVINNKHKYE